VMMEDFHDSARRADEPLDATASVEAEERVTGRGAASSGAATPQAPTGVGAGTSGSRLHRQLQEGGRGRHIRLGDSTGSHRRGLSRQAQVLP
jgi:hypothetical protein